MTKQENMEQLRDGTSHEIAQAGQVETATIRFPKVSAR
jgi:hypothetical protein